MYLKSPYPEIPPTQELNAHYTFFHRPDQAEWTDYTIHIDPATNQRRTYREFLARVLDGATALGALVPEGGLGLRAEDGEVVGILSENSMDYIALVHSLLTIATPFALISSYSTRFELNHALKLSKVTRLFVDARLLPLVLPAAKEAGISSRKIYLLGGHARGRKSYSDLVSDARAKHIPQVGIRPASKDTLAYLVFSSGTSGLPKAVMISHGNIIFSFAQVVVVGKEVAEVHKPPAPPTPEGIPVALAFLPLHHSYGLHVYCFRALLVPTTLIILAKWDIDVALRAIPKYRITILTLIPSVVHQLVNYPKTRKTDLSSVQSMGSGAAYLPPDLASKLSALAPKDAIFSEGYGMSEATISAVVQPFPGVLSGRMKRVPGCTGVLLPGMEARILRDDGSDADVNEPGELWLRGQNTALGYWNNEKANKETFVDGWLRTGDRFKVDGEGYFFFADRAKDTLKVSGIQVSPVEIENVLLAHPRALITDATVAGVSGGRTSDEKVPRAWVVLSESGKKAGAAQVVKELKAWHQENLSKYKWLRGGIEIVKEIPKNPTGKTLRRVLQDRYEHQVAKKLKSKL